MNIKVNGSDMRRLMALSVRFPRAVYKGLGRAGAVYRGKLRKVMRSGGGTEGVPKFASLDPATLKVRRAYGSRVRKIGGSLAKASSIQMYRNSKAEFVVGFISALEPYARMIQTKETRSLARGEKLRIVRAGGVASGYNRPARDIIKPFSKGAGRDLARLALKLTNKILEKAAKA